MAVAPVGDLSGLFEHEQPVLYCEALGAGDGADFELSHAGGDGEVCEKRVFRFATAGTDDGSPTGGAGGVDYGEGLGEGADLVHLDEDGVGGSGFNGAVEAGGICGEEVVADHLNLRAEALCEGGPLVPCVLLETVFERDNGVFLAPGFEEIDESGSIHGAVFRSKIVFAVFKEVGCGDIDRNRDLFARDEACVFDGQG